jgi:hypothetical protein
MKAYCSNCIHFGDLRSPGKELPEFVCLAPVTTEPPVNGEIPAKNRFVFRTVPSGLCELHTPIPGVTIEKTSLREG